MAGLTVFLLCLPALLQLMIFGTFDLGVDEAHYVLYGRHLALSYFDHPPLVGWVHAGFNLLFGQNLFSARLPAILIGLFCVWQLFFFLREQGFSERISASAAFALGTCFQFFVLHLFLLPDSLLLAVIWPLMRATVRVSERPSVRAWLWLGFWLGLAGISKYTAVLFIVPVACLLIPRQGLSFLRGIGFYLGVLVAVVLISPVVIWNARLDWISFRYQASHVLGGESGWDSFVKSLAVQVALYSPFLWGFSIVGIIALWKRQNPFARFAFWTAAANGIFFFISSWKAPLLPHWPMLFYLFAIPMGLCVVLERKPLWAKIPIGITSAVVALLVVLLVSGFGYAIPNALKEVSGWPKFMREVAAHVQGDRQGIAFLNWTYGSRALYYARESEQRVFILDDRYDQFDIWNPERPWGRDLWIVQFSYDEKNLDEILRCDSLSEKEKIPVSARGYAQYDVILRLCKNAQPK